ncbi:DUF3060 domain-containing protein [Rhodococcus jostii]|uniref:DUF3060 domain-containing protein n=1 Tax=Rhodococcus jostii TaxID=132919 RepID=UPI00363DA6B0
MTLMAGSSVPVRLCCLTAFTGGVVAAATVLLGCGAEPDSATVPADASYAPAPTGIRLPSAPSVIELTSGSARYDCAGQDVTVTGVAATITLTGTCGTITVDGTRTTVHLNTVDTIVVHGNSNRITWSTPLAGPAPHVRDTGRRNTIGGT